MVDAVFAEIDREPRGELFFIYIGRWNDDFDQLEARMQSENKWIDCEAEFVGEELDDAAKKIAEIVKCWLDTLALPKALD